MKERLRLEDGYQLFLLEDHGVLFAEQEQEIHSLNTAAAYVWCCLEEEMSQAEIVAAFAESFAIPVAQARKTIGELLLHWEDLGYVHGAERVRGGEIDWNTAVARLVASEALREEFRQSPLATAKRMRLRGSEQKAWVRMRTDEVELCGTLQEEQKKKRPFEQYSQSGSFMLWTSAAGKKGENVLRAVAEAKAKESSKSGRVRYYRIAAAAIRIRYSDKAVEGVIHPVVAHLEIAKTSVQTELEVMATAEGFALLDGLTPIAYYPTIEQIAPRIKAILSHAGALAESYFLEVHAGVVSNGERCVLFPAAPGSGKTTLTAALAHAGFSYFSDELALLQEEGEDLQVRAVPISMSVKEGSRKVLAPLYPQLEKQFRHLREDFETVTYLNPPAAAFRYEQTRSYPVGWIVFPKYQPGVKTELRPIAKADALARMMGEILLVGKKLEVEQVRRLVAWLEKVECYELPNSSLEESVGKVRELLTK